MNPHPRICPAPRTVPGYWDASPDGERLLHATSYAQWVTTAADRTVFPKTANSTVATPDPPAHPILHSAFCILHCTTGYTKHYYAESERIASRIGGGGLQEIGRDKKEHMELFLSHQGRLGDLFETLASCLDAEVRPAENGLKHLYNWRDSVQPETDCYWYHPDHLGSSSWITHTDSHAVQHLHYLPWGEDFVNQRTGSFSSMYTFSAKERDSETGLSYFGSRYYSSDLSIWLSVDPMAGKYPSLSPYTYCADNPVKLVDPNGEEIVGTDGKAVSYSYDDKGNVVWSNNASDDTKRIGNAMLRSETGKEQLDKAIASNTKISFYIVDRGEEPSLMGDARYETVSSYDGIKEPKSATIYIYEQSIKDYLSSGMFGKDAALNIGTFWASQDKETGLDNYMGAVAGHEIEHVVSQENRILTAVYKKNQTFSNYEARELMPNIIKTKILWETYLKF